MPDKIEQFSDGEIIACTSCLAPNDAAIDFCEKCGAPLGATAALDPLKIIRTEAFLVGKATTVEKPKPIIVFGIWLLFFPVLVIGAMIAYSQYQGGFGFEGFVFFWIGSGLAAAAGVILYKVTVNYLAEEAAPDEEN